MSKREIDEQQREWLLRETVVWQAEGLVSPTQSAQILDQYESAEVSSSRQHSWALTVLMSVAGLLVALAVLLLISYNWQELPQTVKLLLIFGSLSTAHGLGYWLRIHRQARVLSEASFFFGSLLYGAGIWLIAQIFHLNSHYPDGMWWWAVGVLPLAMLMETALLHVLCVGLLATWCGMEILGFSHLGAWLFGRWSMLPNGAYSLLVFVSLGLAWAYRKRSTVAVGLYVPLLAWWAVLQPFAWDWHLNAIYFIGGVGGLLLMAGEIHRPGSRYALVYRTWGFLLSAGILAALSFHDLNREIANHPDVLQAFLQALALIIPAAVILAIGAWIACREEAGPRSLTDAWPVILKRQWLPGSLVALMALLAVWSNVIGAPFLATILVNIVMVAFAAWLMHLGLRDDRGRPFAVGVMYFLLWTIMRYIDLFGGFGGMLGAALMFFLCGAVLFGVALYWRRRQGSSHA